MRYFWDTSGVDISWDMDANQRSNSSLHWQIVCIKPKIGVPPRSRVPQAHDPGELGQIWLILDDLSLWDFDHRELLLFLSQKLMSLLTSDPSCTWWSAPWPVQPEHRKRVELQMDSMATKRALRLEIFLAILLNHNALGVRIADLECEWCNDEL